MRSCVYYFTRGFLCVLRTESPYYERYYRANWQYKLVPPDTEIERLFK
jgi:hypothetical protein